MSENVVELTAEQYAELTRKLGNELEQKEMALSCTPWGAREILNHIKWEREVQLWRPIHGAMLALLNKGPVIISNKE